MITALTVFRGVCRDLFGGLISLVHEEPGGKGDKPSVDVLAGRENLLSALGLGLQEPL